MNEIVASLIESVGLVLPEAVLIGAAGVAFLGAAFYHNRHAWGALALAVLLGAAAAWWLTRDARVPVPEASLFRSTALTWFVRGVSLAAGFVFVLFSWNQVSDRVAGEYHGCLLLIIAGTGLVAAANDLVSLFLALEVISIPTYLLLYLPRSNPAAQEATVKYFLLSIFSSALLLYGLSFLYGSVGSTNLDVIRAALRQAEPAQLPPVLVVALVLIVAGLGFRVTAVPFHFYAPDVYEGAPTVGAALLTFIPKVAGFLALFAVVVGTLLVGERTTPLVSQATLLFWILATVSMFLGNVLGLLQDNVRRLLAYSSVAHAGYMLVALGAGQLEGAAVSGTEALFFYLVVYGAMAVGVFAVLALLDRVGPPVATIDDLAGLGRTHPVAALLLTIFLFSLTGLPPTAGFWGKLYIVFAAWFEGSSLYKVLAVLVAINAAIGAWYYLRIVAAMYLRPAVHPRQTPRETPALLATAVCALLTVGLFVAPGLLWSAVERATTPPAAAQPAPSGVAFGAPAQRPPTASP